MLTIPLLNPSTKKERSLHLKMPLQCVYQMQLLPLFEHVDEIAAVIQEAKQIAKNYMFSSMVCVLALSTVIQCGIESYFPVTKDNAGKEKWDSLAKMFHCTIFPWNDLNDGKSNEYVHIFRCAAMPPRYLVDQTF